MEKFLDTKEICGAVAADLKAHRITHKMAAEKIGKSKQTVTNQLSGKRRFSIAMAGLYSEAFGYSTEFLLFGKGELRPQTEATDQDQKAPAELFDESKKIEAARTLLDILNNKLAIAAYSAFLVGDYSKYIELKDILEKDFAYNVPANSAINKEWAETLAKVRSFFTAAETESARDLTLIEKRVAAGEALDIDAEVDRFRKKLETMKERL